MSNLAIITSDSKGVTLTVKNHYSLHFDKENNKLSFISSNLNINESIVRWTYNNKSIVFAYGNVDVINKVSEINNERFSEFKSPDNYRLVIHKSYRNNYGIKKGNGQYKNFNYVVMPSKIFKQFRYAIYDLQREDIIGVPGYQIHFVCKKQRYAIALSKEGDLFLNYLESSFGAIVKTEKINSYVCKPKYLLFDLENGDDFYLSEVFNKSFIMGKRHFAYLKDVTTRMDMWEYFKHKPIQEGEKEAIRNKYKSDFGFKF